MNVTDRITINNITKYIKDTAGQAMIAVEELSTTASIAHTKDSLFRLDGKLYKATNAIAVGDTIVVGTNCVETNIDGEVIKDVQVNGTSVLNNGVANVPEADNNVYGAARLSSDYNLKNGQYKTVISTDRQHKSVFYGLAKSAGDATQSASNNEVGSYTDEAKEKIQHMLGIDTIIASNETNPATNAHNVGELFTLNGKLYQATDAISIGASLVVGTNCAEVSIAGAFPHDVQVNGTSIVSDGVANVPKASTSGLGVVGINSSFGIDINAYGKLYINGANSDGVKAGTGSYRPLSPNLQHASTFYGLAKAAGADMASSSNAVGTYTDSAKASIKSMLGIVDGSTGTVDITGTTPSITAVENTRYVCGEVSTLSFTPAASGICIVRFTSGSTATILTVPNTVKFPEWFDITALEADTIYEMCITDGVYGAVMSWAL